jgi:hypothetical protein
MPFSPIIVSDAFRQARHHVVQVGRFDGRRRRA